MTLRNSIYRPLGLLVLLGLAACASSPSGPSACEQASCAPAGAIDDPAIAELYKARQFYPHDAEAPATGAPVNTAIVGTDGRVIGSTNEDGMRSLAAKIELIEQAQHTVDLVYYIFRDDLVGLAILGALCDAVERGVDVRVMVDSLGSSSLDKTYLRALESCALNAGFMRNADGATTIYRARVQPVIFNAVSRVFVRVNRRSHDKLLVVDGHFPGKDAVMTGGRNIALDYYAILEDGSPNPDAYRDAEILLRGGHSADHEQTVGTVSGNYYSELYAFKNNARVNMTRMRDPDTAYQAQRDEMRARLADLKKLDSMQPYFRQAPSFVTDNLHSADVILAHQLGNLTKSHVVSHVMENASLNPNSIMNLFRKEIQKNFASAQLVSPYLFAAMYKDDDGRVVLDEAQQILDWLVANPDSTLEIYTNSVLTSDNFFTQSVIDMDLVPRLLFPPEMRAAWVDQPHDGELEFAEDAANDWQRLVNHPRLFIYENGRIDDTVLGGDTEYSKLHAKYTLGDTSGFIGTTNFDYRSRLFNNEMGFFFQSAAIADELRQNSAYLRSLSYRWGSPEWLQMRAKLMEVSGRQATTTRQQRSIYKTLKATWLQWFF